MKKTETAAMALLTMLSLAAIAHADVIAGGPSEIAKDIVIQYLPLLLLGVAGVTVFLLQMFRKKRK